MLLFPPLMLLVSSLAAVWLWRPVNGWSGAAASLFTAAILGSVTSVLLISAQVFNGLSHDLLLVLQQALLFAGVPLVAAVWLADAAGQNWDRVIWGRILLGLCAVFEVSRRSGWLDQWLIFVLAAGLVAIFFHCARQKRWLPLLISGTLWGFALILTTQSGSEITLSSMILFTTLLRTKTTA